MKLVAAAGYVPTSFRTVPRFGLVRAATVAEARELLGVPKRAEV